MEIQDYVYRITNRDRPGRSALVDSKMVLYRDILNPTVIGLNTIFLPLPKQGYVRKWECLNFNNSAPSNGDSLQMTIQEIGDSAGLPMVLAEWVCTGAAAANNQVPLIGGVVGTLNAANPFFNGITGVPASQCWWYPSQQVVIRLSAAAAGILRVWGMYLDFPI